MRLSQLAAEKVSLAVKVGDGPEDVVNIVYRPGALTLGTADELRGVMDSGADFDAAGIILEPLLVEWDLTNDDGTPLPCDKVGLRKVPISFLGILMAAVAEDARPNPQMGATLGGTSALTEREDVAQNGTSSSEPRSFTG